MGTTANTGNQQDLALEKIKRLLRLGTSSNENEARAALAKAAELARKHSIDLGVVNAAEERARIAEETFHSEKAFNVVESAAQTLCQALFRVRVVFTAYEATLIGFEHNVAAARFAYAFIVEQCGRDLKVFRKDRRRIRRNTSKGAAYQFCMGWVWAVRRRYAKEIEEAGGQGELEDSRSALILKSQEAQVDDYMAKHHGDVREAKAKRFKQDSTAILRGIRAGEQVQICRPLNPGDGTLRLEGRVA